MIPTFGHSLKASMIAPLRGGSCGSLACALSHLVVLTSSSPLPGPIVARAFIVLSPSSEQGTLLGSTAPVPGLQRRSERRLGGVHLGGAI
jgi:hypothetical protein